MGFEVRYFSGSNQIAISDVHKILCKWQNLVIVCVLSMFSSPRSEERERLGGSM